MRIEIMKRPAIPFPATPEHPDTINPELIYRLEFLKMLDRTARDAEKVEEAACMNTLAFRKAGAWAREWIIKGARTSIDEIGPLSNTAQRSELGKFIRSLEENEKGFAP